MEPLATNLRRRSQLLGLPHAEVARRAGLSERRYGNYVTGDREPDLATLARIAMVLGTTPNDLLGFNEDRPAMEEGINRLITAAQAMSPTDLEMLVVQAEAIVLSRSRSR